MTKSTITREQITSWMNDANYALEEPLNADDAAAARAILAMGHELLAAMDSESVEESVTCWSCRNEVEISAIGDRDGYCPICDAPIDLDEEPHNSPQPAPVVLDERAAFNAWNNEDNLPIAGVGAKNAAWLAWQARSMLQAGNSPVIPDGYVMVPKEPTVNQWAAGMQAFDSGVDKVTRVYKAMLAAAPQEVKGE